MNGPSILAKIIETYANLTSYSDIGSAETSSSPGLPLEFQTDFKRPLFFRFHWLSWHPYHGKCKPASETTIWSDGEKFISKFQGQLDNAERFSGLVAEATGVSQGAVHIILSVLAPDSLGLRHPWHEMTGARVLDDDADSYHLIGSSRAVDDTELWVAKDSFLLYRLKETNVVTEEQCEEMRAYAQSEEQVEIMVAALKKQGISDEMIAETISGLSESFEPTTYVLDYKFNSIKVNQTLDDSLFRPST